MSDLVPTNFGAVSSVFANTAPVDDLSSGIQSSFGLIGYKGKVWSIRYRGDDTPLMRDDGDGPRGSIEVVVLKAAKEVSKIWYENGYVEGSTAAPDCFSNNGVAPEATSLKPQCASCAICPHNQWGSRLTPAGKQGKSCSDSKRLAVVPLADLENTAYGGPMLLRVPAASLQDVAMYGQKMTQMGYPYYSVGTKFSFDAAESYPKFVLNGIRPLTDAEAKLVLALRDSHTVQRILSENEFAAATPAAATPEDDKPLFEQAPDVGAKVDTVGDQARAAAAAQAAQVKAAQDAIAAKAAKDAAAKAAKDAAAAQAKAAKTAPPVEPVTSEVTDEDEEEKALLAALAAARAKKAAAAKAPDPAQQAMVLETAPVEDASLNMASDFETSLDDMLEKLLPK